MNTDRHPQLIDAPDNLLARQSGTGDAGRARALIAWCENRQFRPSLLHLENERKARGIR